MEEHASNGQQQEQPGDRDPRALPTQKSWAEVIAESNRRCAAYRRRIDEQNLRYGQQSMRIGQLTLERDEAIATVVRLEDEIAGLLDALDWDIEAETIRDQTPPF